MKIFLLFVSLFLFAQTSFAQTKVDEYEHTDTDTESARLDAFLVRLQNEPESKGLVIIYSGANKKEIAAVLSHIEGTKDYVELRIGTSFRQKISYKINEQDKPFTKELWIYPKDVPLPEIKPTDFDLSELKNKYLFATTCEECDPVVPLLSTSSANLKLYAELVNKYPDYRSSIIIYPASSNKLNRKATYQDALISAARYRSLLTKHYSISGKRISVVIAKFRNKYKVTTAKFYIDPKRNK